MFGVLKGPLQTSNGACIKKSYIKFIASRKFNIILLNTTVLYLHRILLPSEREINEVELRERLEFMLFCKDYYPINGGPIFLT